MDAVEYEQAVEIMRYYQKRTKRQVRLSEALDLAKFSFPLEEKLHLIDQVIYVLEMKDAKLYSLAYLREPFHAAESKFHKGEHFEGGGIFTVGQVLEVIDNAKVKSKDGV